MVFKPSFTMEFCRFLRYCFSARAWRHSMYSQTNIAEIPAEIFGILMVEAVGFDNRPTVVL